MAGTVTRTQRLTFGDTTLVADYTFAYGDEHDGVDWDGDPEGLPDESVFDLTGDIVVTVTGPGTIHAVFFRQQGRSRNPWREGDLSAANTPLTFPTGSGPNPRVVSDLRGADAWRVD